MLKDIQSIDYSWGEIDFEVNSMRRSLSREPVMYGSLDDSYDLNIEPDDIEVSDTVTVVWEIS